MNDLKAQVAHQDRLIRQMVSSIDKGKGQGRGKQGGSKQGSGGNWAGDLEGGAVELSERASLFAQHPSGGSGSGSRVYGSMDLNGSGSERTWQEQASPNPQAKS